MQTFPLQIERANESHLSALAEGCCPHTTFQPAEDVPENTEAVLRVSKSMCRSNLSDILNSDCVWLLIAIFGNKPGGLAARIANNQPVVAAHRSDFNGTRRW